ncbi:MAG: hypothetical protein J2P15_03000 [Micromonosporaceae bacterium]|nr:hypothetical protein [Micromonosporaceae bacterium]
MFDIGQYERRVRNGPCFVCALVAGHPDYRHHVVYGAEKARLAQRVRDHL